MSKIPIVLFTYNRLEHTKQVIDNLKNNFLATESELFIYSDGPKSDKDDIKIQVIRAYLRTLQGFKRVYINERKINFGLSKNIISGVTEVINKFKKIIVLEDDLVTSPYFLTYMNDALNYYEKQEDVACIHGYIYPIKKKVSQTFFLKGADCWGWGTWARAWDLFEPNGQTLLNQILIRELEKEFNFDYSYPYVQMLKDQIAGLNDSWAIRWYASAFLKNKLVLYPGHSLVQNIGNDSTGTHSSTTSNFDINLYSEMIPVETEVSVSKDGYEAFIDYFNSLKTSKKSLRRKIKDFLKLGVTTS